MNSGTQPSSSQSGSLNGNGQRGKQTPTSGASGSRPIATSSPTTTGKKGVEEKQNVVRKQPNGLSSNQHLAQSPQAPITSQSEKRPNSQQQQQQLLRQRTEQPNSTKEIRFRMSEDRENIVKIVSAYLIKNHCERTNMTFLEEIFQPSNPVNQKDIFKSTLFTSFEKGERDLFFTQWASLPHEVQENQIDKVEFYLQIYFLIYAIHPLSKSQDRIDNERIEYFRAYLDSKGSELSRTTELLSFYALPYIQKPSEHQGFKQLFTKEWVQDLRSKLKESIEKITEQDNETSPLEDLYFARKEFSQPISAQQKNPPARNEAADLSYIDEIAMLKANNSEQFKLLKEVNSKYSQLHKIYVQTQEQAKQAIMDSQSKWFKFSQDLLQLSKELIGIVDGQAKGVNASARVLETKKKKLNQFEHFLGQSIDDLVGQSQDISLFEKQVTDIFQDISPTSLPSGGPSKYSTQSQQQQVYSHQFQQQLQQQQQQQQEQQQNKYQPNWNQQQQHSHHHQNSQQQLQNQQHQQQSQQQMQQQSQMQQHIEQQHRQQQFDNFILPDQGVEEINEDYQAYAPLDYWKMKNTLIESSDPGLKVQILQALRWRIVKTRNPYQRREVILSFTMNDVLGCAENPGISPLEHAILNSSHTKLTEFALRLVNALASDFEGRSYLVESNSLVELLIQILKREKEDSSTRRNALGALQKLSLRKKPQIVMIQNDLIKWIVSTLRNEKDVLSEYSYEYATALFMNLSLRSLGREKCEDPSIRVLEVLQQLLEHENGQVRTFVNGTLYSLLQRPILKEQSKQLSLLQYLTHLRDTSDDRSNKQIQYIINQLEHTESNEQSHDGPADDYGDNISDEDDDNDEDDIEEEGMNEDDGNFDDDNEDDEDEDFDYQDGANLITLQVGSNSDNPQMLGEDLLVSLFNLRGQEALRQQNLTRSALEESKRNAQNSSILNQSRITNNRPEPFNRPATPSLSISQISHSQIGGTSFYESKKNRQSSGQQNLHNNPNQNSSNTNNNNHQNNILKQNNNLNHVHNSRGQPAQTNNYLYSPPTQQQSIPVNQTKIHHVTPAYSQGMMDTPYHPYYEDNKQVSNQAQINNQANSYQQKQNLKQPPATQQASQYEQQQQAWAKQQQYQHYQQQQQVSNQFRQHQQSQIPQQQQSNHYQQANNQVYGNELHSHGQLQQNQFSLQQSPVHQQQKRVPSTQKLPSDQKVAMQDTQTKEAFAARPKIPRTPPSSRGEEIVEDL